MTPSQENNRKEINIKIYVVFHKTIFSGAYKELKHYLNNVVFFGVQKRLPKNFNSDKKYDIVYEGELDIYDSGLQKKGFNETSAIYHVYVNRLYTGLDYVGFAQYDMILSDGVFQTIENHTIANPNKNFIFYLEKARMMDKKGFFWEAIPYDFIIKSYNKHFQTKHTAEEIRCNHVLADNLVLFSTFIIPTDMFEKIMVWISKLIYEIYPWANRAPFPTYYNHLGVIIERAYGFALSLELLNKDTELIQVPIEHSPKLSLKNQGLLKRLKKDWIDYFIWKVSKGSFSK